MNLPRVGNKIQFVEEDKGLSQKGAYIETAGGHKLRINDSQKFEEIETKGGHKLRLEDRMRRIIPLLQNYATVAPADRI